MNFAKQIGLPQINTEFFATNSANSTPEPTQTISMSLEGRCNIKSLTNPPTTKVLIFNCLAESETNLKMGFVSNFSVKFML